MIRTGVLLCALFLAGCTGLKTGTTSGDKNGSSESAMQAYTTLGLQYLQTGDTANAKIAVQRALDISDDYAPAYNALALIFQAEDEIGLAEQYYLKAIANDSDSAMLYNNYGAFLFAQERYQEACTHLAKATEDPFYNRRAQAFENLGLCYRKIGRDDVAKHAFERALRTGGTRPVTLVELADLSMVSAPADAERYYEQFTQQVNDKRINHTARSLWVGIQLARENSKATTAATYALLLKNLYPDSKEYQQYKESAR